MVPARVRGGEQRAGQLDLALDRAVEVEVPVEAVVVVADGGEERDHQAPLAAGLGRAVEDVRVLPEDPGVLLMDADGVADRPRLAAVAGHRGVQVGDLAEAVAAQLERVGPLPDQVLAGVEIGLPVPELRVPVGHHHLGDGCPVDDRPVPPAVADADLVQDQPLAGVEADPHGPALPAQQLAFEGETRALRLGDLDGPQRGPVRPADGRVVIVTGLLRHRQHELIHQLDDPPLDQVHVGGHAVHRVRPGVAVLVVPDEREHPDQPPPVLAGEPERPGGQRAGPDAGHVVQPAPGHRRPPLRVGPDHLLRGGEVLVDDRHLPVGPRVEDAPADHLAPGQRDHHVAGFAGGHVDQERPQPAVGRLPGRAEHLVLGGLLQPVVGEAHRLGQQARRGQDVPPGQVLGRAGRRSG